MKQDGKPTTSAAVDPSEPGLRYAGAMRLTATFTDGCRLALSTADIPTKTENAPIVGESSIHTFDDLKRHRPNEVAFLLAKLTLEKYFRDDDGNDKPCFPQLLLLIEFAHDAADRIYKAIVASTDGTAVLKPILRPYDTIGSTRYVDFDTTRPVFATESRKHLRGIAGVALHQHRDLIAGLAERECVGRLSERRAGVAPRGIPTGYRGWRKRDLKGAWVGDYPGLPDLFLQELPADPE